MTKKLLFLSIVLIIIIVFSLFTGVSKISFLDFILGNLSETDKSVFWNFRFYRVIGAALIGAVLAVAGLTLQSLFANPLVEPYTLGISGGANLGICFAVVISSLLGFGGGALFGNFGFFAFGILGAAAISSVLLFSAFLPNQSANRILLTGVTISYISAGTSMLLLSFVKSDDLQKIINWGLGSVAELDEQSVIFMTVIFVPCVVFLTCKTMIMNVLQFGEEDAKALGISVKKERISLLAVSSILVANAVSFCGSIGFVGLLSPHIARKIFGEDNRILLPASMLVGALLLTIADLIARTLFVPRELPAGVITGIFGGLLFIYLLNSKEK